MEYLDYNRTVVGYHGTTVEVARRIVLREVPFTASANPGDWLGRGIYFWEHAPKQAWAWARHQWPNQPVAVLGSMVRLGNCLDLLDPANVRFLRETHDRLVAARAVAGLPPLKNVRGDKRLDCAVFEHAYLVSEEDQDRTVDTCRAVYARTGGGTGHSPRAWPTAWVLRDSHIQLCVRNPACILGTWMETEGVEATAGGRSDVQAQAHPHESAAQAGAPPAGTDGPGSPG